MPLRDGKDKSLPSQGRHAHVMRKRSRLHMRLAYDFQPGGPSMGSPPSPPPHLIRPAVRRLLWSPRLLGPGPRGQGVRRNASSRRTCERPQNHLRGRSMASLLHRSHIPAMAFAIPDPVFGIPCSLAGASKSSEGDSPPMPGNSGFGRHSNQSVPGALVRCSLLFSLLTGNYRGERFVLDWPHYHPAAATNTGSGRSDQ